MSEHTVKLAEYQSRIEALDPPLTTVEGRRLLKSIQLVGDQVGHLESERARVSTWGAASPAPPRSDG